MVNNFVTVSELSDKHNLVTATGPGLAGKGRPSRGQEGGGMQGEPH